MKKTLIAFCAIIVTTLGIIFTSDSWLEFILDAKPREPRHEIPITYNIGRWPYQEALQIDTVSVEIIDSRLNLFNSESLISYRIKGRLVLDRNNSESIINKIHICERLVQYDTKVTNSAQLNIDTVATGESNFLPQAIIELTPIIGVKENESYKARQIIDFDITNEHIIESLRWGYNYLLIKCGHSEFPLVLHQTK